MKSWPFFFLKISLNWHLSRSHVLYDTHCVVVQRGVDVYKRTATAQLYSLFIFFSFCANSWPLFSAI